MYVRWQTFLLLLAAMHKLPEMECMSHPVVKCGQENGWVKRNSSFKFGNRVA